MVVPAVNVVGDLVDDAGAAAVANAAEQGRWIVVPHALSADLVDDLDIVADYAQEMPARWSRVVDGAVEPVDPCPPRELGPGPVDSFPTTVTRLYHLQRSPRYRPLTDAIYDPLERAWSTTEPWLERDAGFFLSAGGGVTSAHADRHHNLLLQLSGRKQIGLCVPGSRAHARAIARSGAGLRVDAMPAGTQTIELEPGAALYLPPYALHWVRSLEPSVAVSCGWSTARTVRVGRVHAANAALIRVGIPAQPIGGRRDDVKLAVVDGVRRARSALRRS